MNGKPNPFNRGMKDDTITLPDEKAQPKQNPTIKRSRTKTGVRTSVVCHSEELEVLKYVAEKEGLSVASIMRTASLAKCKEVLGEFEYEKLLQAYRDK